MHSHVLIVRVSDTYETSVAADFPEECPVCSSTALVLVEALPARGVATSRHASARREISFQIRRWISERLLGAAYPKGA